MRSRVPPGWTADEAWHPYTGLRAPALPMAWIVRDIVRAGAILRSHPSIEPIHSSPPILRLPTCAPPIGWLCENAQQTGFTKLCQAPETQLKKLIVSKVLLGNSSTVEQRTLTPSILVRIQVPQPKLSKITHLPKSATCVAASCAGPYADNYSVFQVPFKHPARPCHMMWHMAYAETPLSTGIGVCRVVPQREPICLIWHLVTVELCCNHDARHVPCARHPCLGGGRFIIEH